MSFQLPVFALVAAGIIHLILAPSHFEHAPAHGLFFALAGVAEIAWALAFWRKPSRQLYYTGITLSGGLLVLWLITRFMAAPFEGEVGVVEWGGLVCKISELAGIVALGSLAIGGKINQMPRTTLVKTAGVSALLALAAGLVSYGAGLALEPVFPSLAGTGDHAHGGEMNMGGMDNGVHSGGEGMLAATIGDLEILDPVASPVQAGMIGGVFLQVRNHGQHEDHLLGASSEASDSIEIHETVMEGDVMKMHKVNGGLEVPAEGVLALEHGGYHLMLINVQYDLAAGDHFDLTLDFEHAGPVTFEVHVAAP